MGMGVVSMMVNGVNNVKASGGECIEACKRGRSRPALVEFIHSVQKYCF